MIVVIRLDGFGCDTARVPSCDGHHPEALMAKS